MTTDDSAMMLDVTYLAEIEKEIPNCDVRNILAELQQLCCRRANRVEPEKLSEFLDDLRDHLALQFSWEEAYDYMHDPALAPDLNDRAEGLRHEHESLFRQVADLADEAEALLYPLNRRTPIQRVVERFWRFRRCLLAHEAAENDFVCEAFYRDLGVGD